MSRVVARGDAEEGNAETSRGAADCGCV